MKISDLKLEGEALIRRRRAADELPAHDGIDTVFCLACGRVLPRAAAVPVEDGAPREFVCLHCTLAWEAERWDETI